MAAVATEGKRSTRGLSERRLAVTALRAFPVSYASDVEAVALFWELLGFRRHVQLPPDGPRFEMYVYVDDLEAVLARLIKAQVTILREVEDMAWGERIATVADPEGNPVALCQNK